MSFQRTLEEILDSDDELTIDFTESPYVPAYQDEDRFEYFKNLSENKKDNFEEKQKYIKKGIFNKKDTFCFQSIQKISNDTLLWFFEFLLHKDLQSNYKFLKSCLVPKYEQVESKVAYESMNQINEKCRYKIVINE